MWLAITRVRRTACALHGHDMAFHFEAERLSLQCLACGARTPGWTIDVKPMYRSRRRNRATAARVSGLLAS
jgi:hypothetical protein